MTSTLHRKLTVLVPAYNEEDCLPIAYEELTLSLKNLPCDYEVLVVDNGSSDNTEKLCSEFCRRDPRWKYLRFSRNFNVEASMAAGFQYASGDAIITVYSDLQDPPDRIPDFVAKWMEGYEVVYGVRTKRPGDPAWRNFLVMIAYRLIHWLSDCSLPTDAGDFCLITRRVRDVLIRMGEQNRYTRGMIHWVGFRRCTVPYERRPRAAGQSKSPFFAAADFFITAITSFSVKPLRMFTLVGVAVVVLAILLAIAYAIGWAFLVPPRGITTTFILLLANLGMMSLGFGILGEYIGRIYTESKCRPLWVVEKTINLDLESSGDPSPEHA